MCKPPCCETSSGGGGVPAPIAALGLVLAAAVAVRVLTAVVHAVDAAVPYILAGLGMVAVAGTVGTIWLVARGTPPAPAFTSKTNRQHLGRTVPETASLTWTAQVLAIGGKPVTVPASHPTRGRVRHDIPR